MPYVHAVDCACPNLAKPCKVIRLEPTVGPSSASGVSRPGWHHLVNVTIGNTTITCIEQ